MHMPWEHFNILTTGSTTLPRHENNESDFNCLMNINYAMILLQYVFTSTIRCNKTSRKPDSSLKCQNIVLSNIFVNSLAETIIANTNKGNRNVILMTTPELYQRSYATSIDHFHKWLRILLFISYVN